MSSRIVPGLIGQLVYAFREVEILSDDEGRPSPVVCSGPRRGKTGHAYSAPEWRAHVFPMTYTAYWVIASRRVIAQ